MLSYLPTEEAVRTSVLSSRWKSLWLFMSEIDLDTCKFRGGPHAFMSFMEKFLDSSSRVEKPCLHKVKLTTVEDDFTRWIDFVATPELEHLDFECKPVVSGTLMPLRLYTCSPKLRHLRLHGVFLGSTSVSLPCLKTMRLENNTYADEACLELLISSCPLLEDFSFVRMHGSCGVNVLRVHSKTLTSLSIETGVHDYDFQNNDRISVKVLINAPRLKYLNLCDFISECKTISNVGSLTKVNLGRYCDNVPDHFFTGISEVRDMKIAGSAFRVCLHIIFRCLLTDRLILFLCVSEYHPQDQATAPILEPVMFGSRCLFLG